MNPTPLPNGFMVLHGNRLEDLRDLLVSILKARPLAPLQEEVILVQSNGMKHWLEIALAQESALGICAATRIELPSSFLWQAYRSVLGASAIPARMPFDKHSLVWRLMRMLPKLVDQHPVYQPLQHYLAADARGDRRYQLALQLADVFDGYQSYRADWLSDWSHGALGADTLRRHDGQVTPLPPGQHWQAQLWRDLRSDIGAAQSELSRANVHARFTASLHAPAAPDSLNTTALPPRIVVFGISSLPMQAVEALAALGQVCQVLMLVQNPCQHYWGDIVEGRDLLRKLIQRRQKSKAEAAGLVPAPDSTSALAQSHSESHPLLASWGKQGRDYLHLLDTFDAHETYARHFSRIDCFVDPLAEAAPTRLRCLQSSILNLDSTPRAPAWAVDDASIACVSTHSAQREVEVLHDQIWQWLDADPSLQPGEIMVMVPDIETFAPHIQAVFGRFSAHEARYIPYSLGDTTPRSSPLVQALEQLLNLPTARITLAECLSLLEVPAVQNRFNLSEGDVEQAHAWLAAAGVRWGLDGAQRQRWGVSNAVADREQNTWAFGLRRLLLGYALGKGAGKREAWAGTLPQAALGSLDAPVFDGVLDWLDAVTESHAALAVAQTPGQWLETLSTLVRRFFLAVDAREERRLLRLLEPLETWLALCEEARLDEALPLEVVREYWLSQLAEDGLGQRFFGGGVQFGTLMPMRSIPFRIIGLLGMNDGDYPRQKPARDFDLMAQGWRLGDRSRREDDRYLFLEALLSAREKLYVSWQGKRATDNAELPPSVLVAQLLDYFRQRWNSPIAVRQHPLQPFSQAYFDADSALVTYAADWARMHVPSVAAAADSGALSGDASRVMPPASLRLDDVRQLLRQPVDVFFRARLQVRFDRLDAAEQEDEPFELDQLEQYQLSQPLLEASDPGQAIQTLRLIGRLPMAAFGDRLAADLVAKAGVVRARQLRWRASHPVLLAPFTVDLHVAGTQLTGALTNLFAPVPLDVSDVAARASLPHAPLLQVSARIGAILEGKGKEKRPKAHVLADLWVNHLAGCALGLNLRSVLLGLDSELRLPALPADTACDLLAQLIDAYGTAWRAPAPVACKTAWAFLHAQRAGAEDPHASAQAVFEDGFNFDGEQSSSANLKRAFEGYDDLQAGLPDWAERLYAPLARYVEIRVEETGEAQEADA